MVNRKNRFKKIVSLVIICTFLFSNVSFAFEKETLAAALRSKKKAFASIFNIPHYRLWTKKQTNKLREKGIRTFQDLHDIGIDIKEVFTAYYYALFPEQQLALVASAPQVIPYNYSRTGTDAIQRDADGLSGVAGAVNKVQKAITFLIQSRDKQYLQAVGSTNTAGIVPLPKFGEFAPGHDVFQKLKGKNAALIACNVVNYNQIEAHLLAAMKQRAVIILEVSRSQLDYALDENKLISYIREIAKRINCNIPIVLHGDHIQYTGKPFVQKAILKEEYEKSYGKGTFKEDMDIDKIDAKIFIEVQQRLKENAMKERKQITAIIERLIKTGFTSIAIDASTIFDTIAGDIVLNYYLNYGTDEEKLVARLEKDFALSLEWGAEFLKLDPGTQKTRFEEIKNKIIFDMRKHKRPKNEISDRITELESIFGIIVKEAKENGLKPEKVIAAYDRFMKAIAQATIAGEIERPIYDTLTDKQKNLLLPTSNARETEYQLKMVQSLLKKHNPELLGHLGIEIEVGHVDRKVPNLRRGGKMEAGMTHPVAVEVMGGYLKSKGLSFDFIATNNGSGHGTDYDKKTLVPISQVGKISLFLTGELQREAEKFGAFIAQHGTTGSDMQELSELSKIGVLKFNISTNYQQILLNTLSLLDDGLQGAELQGRVEFDTKALVTGLHEDVRKKIMRMAQEIAKDTSKAEVKADDSLFTQFIKKTYFWGRKKEKINDDSSKEEIALVVAKEFKRVFHEMDKQLKNLSEKAGAINVVGAASVNKALDMPKELALDAVATGRALLSLLTVHTLTTVTAQSTKGAGEAVNVGNEALGQAHVGTQHAVVLPNAMLTSEVRKMLRNIRIEGVPYRYREGDIAGLNGLIGEIEDLLDDNPQVRYTVIGPKDLFDHLGSQGKMEGTDTYNAITNGLFNNARVLPFNPTGVDIAGEYQYGGYAFGQELVVAGAVLSVLTVEDLNDQNPMFNKAVRLMSILTSQDPRTIKERISVAFIGKGVSIEDSLKEIVNKVLNNIILLHWIMVDMTKANIEELRQKARATRDVLWSL